MSRLIDADAMLEYLNLMYDERHSWRSDYNTGVLGAINYIKHKAPIIDAVSVVRCKDCRHHNTHRCFMAFDMIATDDDGYCYMGERKTDHE